MCGGVGCMCEGVCVREWSARSQIAIQINDIDLYKLMPTHTT